MNEKHNISNGLFTESLNNLLNIIRAACLSDNNNTQINSSENFDTCESQLAQSQVAIVET